MTPDVRFWNGRPVCVVGGTGFLGWHMARQLADLEATVRIFGLPPRNDHPLLHQSAIEPLFGDVRDRAAVARAVAGCAAVFNVAGVVSARAADRAGFRAVHRDAIQNILGTAEPAARIIHTSSITTLGPSRPGKPITEDTRPSSDIGVDYVAAKGDAEQVALAAAEQGRDVIVMHPGFLIGPDDYDRSLMGRVCLRFWNGRLPLVPPGGVSFVDVRDVAAGHILAAEHGSPRRRYVLGGENHTSREFTQALAAAGGVRPRLSPQLSHWGLFAVAGVLEMYYGLRGRTPFPCWQDARLQVYHWYADSTRAHRELGFRARPLAETLADSFAWHREEGLIKRRGLRRWWMRPADAHPLAGATSRLTRPRPSSPEVLSARQRTVGT